MHSRFFFLFVRVHNVQTFKYNRMIVVSKQCCCYCCLLCLFVCLQLDIDELSVENSMSKSFDQVIKMLLDPIWNQLVREFLKFLFFSSLISSKSKSNANKHKSVKFT